MSCPTRLPAAVSRTFPGRFARSDPDRGGRGRRQLLLSPAELAELSAEINDLLGKWYDRQIPDDGQQRESVFVFARGMPAAP